MVAFAKTQLVTAAEALPGRETALPVPTRHEVLHTPMVPPYPEGTQIAEFAMGCFWGVERGFWQLGAEGGVVTTAAGYAGGYTPNPTYEEVCTGRTGHTEAIRVVFDPDRITYTELLRRFWEGHDPTQGMRQGGDVGTQYRSAIFVQNEEQRKAAESSRQRYQEVLNRHGYGTITTEILPAGTFYFAEDYHQQYLADTMNPNGYCGVGGTGVSCPIGVAPAD